MNKVAVLIKEDRLIFDKYEKEISDQDLNNTNVINAKNLKFTLDYIKKNIDLISTFFELITIKFKLKKVEINSNDIAEVALSLLNRLTNITSIVFKENATLSYAICDLLYYNKNINKVECYNLPEIMFKRFKPNVISTRVKILEVSELFKYNGIKTYSDIYNKKTLIIDELFSNKDIDELKYFIENNCDLKKIIFKKYSLINIRTISKLLNKNNHKDVTLIILENAENNEDVLKNIDYFSKLEKEYKVNIKIKYSKKYKEKNVIKEFNYLFAKIIVLAVVIIGIIIAVVLKVNEKVDYKEVQKNLSIIQKIKENNEEAKDDNNQNDYISEYYTNYSKVYSELLKVNSDTVGWITVNETKIDYPVVQGKDNDYYLKHSFNRVRNDLGWVFADYRNDIGNDFNTIIYGHSMIENGLMFSTLKNVISENWYTNQNNHMITFNVRGVEKKYKVFSVYTIPNTIDYLNVNFNNSKDTQDFINLIKNRSIYDFREEVKTDDKILTLSTCYNNADYRVVLHAKLL